MGRFRLSNFTPLVDDLIEKYGLITASIYGRVWRYTNGGVRDCTASTNRIAEDLGLNRRTAANHLKILIDAGELIDKTPDRRNAPHVLNIVRQLSLDLGLYLVNGVNQIPTIEKSEDEAGVNQVHTRCESDSQEDTIKETIKDQELKKKGKKKKGGKKRDPLLDHPAIINYRDEAHLQVPASWRKEVAETVGDTDEANKLWLAVVHDWIGFGWNKQNIKSMLELFRERQALIADPLPALGTKLSEKQKQELIDESNVALRIVEEAQGDDQGRDKEIGD